MLLADRGFTVSRILEQAFAMRFADGSALLRHSLVKWFLDGWRRAIGTADEHRVFDTFEARLNALVDRRQCLATTVPMAYIECIVQ
jgi:hypothetical protein